MQHHPTSISIGGKRRSETNTQNKRREVTKTLQGARQRPLGRRRDAAKRKISLQKEVKEGRQQKQPAMKGQMTWLVITARARPGSSDYAKMDKQSKT